MRKEDIHGIYDGSIFYKKTDAYKLKQMEARDQFWTLPNISKRFTQGSMKLI